ncbi:hypothetical protein ACFXDO_05430 [Streptomyces nigra]|uniref:hypothetical protein n=1 Tax=Streptomyces nigra TaxID=1827580 RepID=UPI0036CECD9B
MDSQVYGPEGAVEDYFGALTEGRAEDLLELLGGTDSGPLLTQAVLDRQRKAAPMTGVRISELEESEDTAAVTVTYTVTATGTRPSCIWSPTRRTSTTGCGGAGGSWAVSARSS